MSVTRYPIRDVTPAAPPRPRALKDLTVGQVIALLRIQGSAAAMLIASALHADAPAGLRISAPEDQCTLAILGLVYMTRAGATLTGKGDAWSRQILG